MQVQYGMIEVGLAAPNLAAGLWSAAWMPGTSAQTWPRNGEIDIMGQGHKAACVPGNESRAAWTAWQNKSYVVTAASLAKRFVKYRLYWTDAEMLFTIIDNGVERDLYNATLPVNPSALWSPFYLLLNLAVGGNSTDAATAAQVMAPRPRTM
ncbi:glycoside hydrolase family 16 protein [Massilia aerilata]|uniref:Family 16 glycosylhydrolase n=1 Tax=Massilia aerilata TaxID=453817 RepID=A0ABW0RSP9_9BURK